MLLAVAAVAVGVLTTAGYLISPETVRSEVLNGIRSATGLNPILGGKASVTLFPKGSVSFADTAFKAHSLAVEGLERIADLQLKTLENRVSATVEFWTEAAEVRDFDALKAFWPKGVNLVKESTEKFYANGQEVFGVTLKTSEALGQLAKGSFEAANDNFTKQVNAVKKAATAAAK